MNATADDWESLEQIVPEVCRYHGPAEATTVAQVIARLVAEGLLEEMRGQTVEAGPMLQEPVEFWFRMTGRGRTVWQVEAKQYADGQGGEPGAAADRTRD
jgi:hypothetical protein